MDFFRKVPKIELHAHLNGSLSNRTLKELGAIKYGKDDPATTADECFYKITTGQSLTLKECFQKFKYAHDLTDQQETLAYATRAVIQDFAADNVVYLELRTTPKTTAHMSKKQYLTTVLDTIRKVQNEIPSITVKLLPSIDRSKGLQEAEENVSLVVELCEEYPDIIKGMDLSGAPFGTSFSDFGVILKKAQSCGLKMALHCGEFEDDDEIRDMFEFGTDRIGHGTFIRGTNLEVARKRGIPFECCLTSNVKCSTVSSYKEHHFKKLWDGGFAVCICTDDFGVFDTTLSQELSICCETYGLNLQDIIQLQENTIHYTFASEEEKQKLMEIFNNFKNTVKFV
ncbi:adenosine deaminase-like protein [Topomyia yanbarensis]|uniref:adenosine deaminase-like protein n=1 Tax=Topomyia yanbarensis TaxID=2498891 RepID=UPI00273B4D1D|nr:adenosine deaminase-like protein [Topomyia yanbarensis]